MPQYIAHLVFMERSLLHQTRFLCPSKCCILICRCMQNHNDDTIKTSGHSSLEKYISHLIERVVCERELETEQRLQHIDPSTLLAITVFLSRSPGVLNRRPRGPASPVTLVLIPVSSLQLIWTPADSIGGPEGPLCWVLVLSIASYLQLTWTSCAPSYIIVLRPLNSTRRQSRLFPDILDWMHLLFTQVHFLFWQLGRVGGQYTTKDFESIWRSWI